MAMQPSHAFREIGVGRLDQEMQVRAHQAIAEAEPSVSDDGRDEHRDVADPILVGLEDQFVVDAMHARVVNQTALVAPMLARHEQQKPAGYASSPPSY
jgi:hypothetical protein